MTKAQPVRRRGGLSSPTPIVQETAPPPDAPEAEDTSNEKIAEALVDEVFPPKPEAADEDPLAQYALPPRRRRREERDKLFMYANVSYKQEVERLVLIGRNHFNTKDWEVYNIILRVGLDNPAEIHRALRNLDTE